MSGAGGSPSYRLAPTITNGFGLASLIVGIVSFCTPMIGGLAAIVLGFLGIRRSKQTHTGKEISVAGIVLGCLSIVLWAIFGGTFLALLHITSSATTAARNALLVDPPRTAVEQFLRDVTGNNLSGASSESTIAPEAVSVLRDQVKDLGLVQNVDCSNFNSDNSDNSLQGIATFEKGQRHYTAHVSSAGGTYRVTSLAISP